MLKQMLALDNGDIQAQFGSNLKLRLETDFARFSLRIVPENLAAASKAFGLKIPQKIGDLTQQDDKLALCIGPDEWYLSAKTSDLEAIETNFAALYQKTICSLVDISHREVSIIIEGERAAYLLQAAIAFDLATMPVQKGCRSLIDKSQIVLMHRQENLYRLEVWNSYAGHVWTLLKIIGKEIELDI